MSRRLLCLGLALVGCSSPLTKFESGLAIVRQLERPDERETLRADELLREARDSARQRLAQRLRPSIHDQTAYLIPLADVARARLYARLGDLSELERAGWAAIGSAEVYLGAHIEAVRTRSEGAPPPSTLGSSVFFRREKIRRHVFGMLAEAYREARERDLQILSLAQLQFSDQYLSSEVAHQEERFIREVENSDWWERLEKEKSDISFLFSMVFLQMAQAAEQAALENERQTLVAQLQTETNPQRREALSARIAQIDFQKQQMLRRQQREIAELRANYEAQQQQISATSKSLVVQGLRQAFELQALSDEIRKLRGYENLLAAKDELDDYLAKDGFDANAAQALIDLRTSLDELTREAQERRSRR